MPPPTHAQQETNFTNFLVLMETTPSMIRNELNQRYVTQHQPPHFPQAILSNPIHFSPMHSITTHKIAHIHITNHTHTDQVTKFILSFTSESHAFTSHSPPQTGYLLTHIDTSPPALKTFPTNCHILHFPLHCMGLEHPPSQSNTELIQSLETHRITYHSDLFFALPTTSLSAISWFKCECHQLLFTQQHFDTHTQSCPTAQSTIQMHTNQQTPRNITYDHLFCICPDYHLDDLQALVDANTDEQTLKNHIVEWMINATSTGTSEANTPQK
jgi:hypothetical protein